MFKLTLACSVLQTSQVADVFEMHAMQHFIFSDFLEILYIVDNLHIIQLGKMYISTANKEFKGL